MKDETRCQMCERTTNGPFGRLCCRCDQIRLDAFLEFAEAGES